MQHNKAKWIGSDISGVGLIRELILTISAERLGGSDRFIAS